MSNLRSAVYLVPAKSLLRIYVVIFLGALFGVYSGATAESADACETPLFGITYSHYQIDTTAVCRNGGDAARVMAKGAILPNYDKPQVRSRVRSDLAHIKLAGYDIVRTVLWFTQDKIALPWGQLALPLQSADASRLKTFGADIRAAAFKGWLIAFAPGGQNSPGCKRKSWGDCYDPARKRANFEFISSVHRLLASLSGPEFQITYDLSSERCPSRWLPPLANDNIVNYTSDLIKWYSANVSSTDFHIACGGLADDRTVRLLEIFDAAGVKTNAIDVHFYDTDAKIIAAKLIPAAKVAQQRGVPLIIGEMQYENSEQISAISSIARSHNICLAQIIEWPLHGRDKCQMNVEPPFSPGLLRSEFHTP